MKKGLKICGWVLAAVILLLLGGVVAIQSPAVQTALGHRVVRLLEDRLDGEIRFGEVSVKPFDALVLTDVLILDRAPFIEEGMPVQDTLLRAGHLSAKFSLNGLLRGRAADVSRVRLEHAAFNLVIEPKPDGEGGRTNLERVFRIPKGDPDKPKKEFGDILRAGRVEIEDMTFRLVNIVAARNQAAQGKPVPPPSVINWNDLEVNTSLQARNISVSRGIVSGTVDGMTLDEKSGFHAGRIAGRARVGKGRVLLDDLTLDETDSQLYLKYFRMIGPLDDYKDFLNRIRLEAEILPPSVFSMQTVSHFAPDLDRFSFVSDLQGRVSGYVNDFAVKDLRFLEHGSGVSALVGGSMTGLPAIGSALLDFTVRDLTFGLGGIGTFVRGWAPDVKLDLGHLARGTSFRFDGSAKGPLNRLRARGDIRSGIGSARADVTLRNVLDKRRPILIGGTLHTQDLDIGRIIGTDAVRELTLDTGLEATLTPGDMQVRIDSLDISRLNALGYDYTGIAAVGTYSDQAFDGRIVAGDPNLNFMFQGLFNLSPQTRNAAYQFYANLGYADLQALNIDKRGGRSKVSFQTNANFIRTDRRDVIGEVNIADLVLENDSGRHDIGTVSVNAHANDDIHRIRFSSRFADGTFVGNKSILSMVSDLRDLVVGQELPALDNRKDAAAWEGTPYEVGFTFHDAREVLDFIAPGLYIENNTALKLKVSADGGIQGSARSGRLAYGGKYLKDLQLTFNNQGDALHADFTSSALKVGGIELLNDSGTLFADDNHIGLGFSYDNETEADNRGEIFLSGELARGPGGVELTAQALPSNIYYNGNGWSLHSEDITYRDGDLRIEAFKVSSNEQTVLVNGGFSPTRKDTLSVRMEKFDISLLNQLLGGKLDLQGRATGRALLVSPSRPSVGLLAGITCDSTMVAGHRAGQVRMASVWNEEKNRFDFYVRNNLDEVRNMDINGYLMPSSKEISVRAALQHLDIGYAAPLLDGIFSDFGGYLDGTVRAGGTLDRLRLSSENLQLTDGLLKVEYTQVPYRVSGPVELNDAGLFFRNVQVRDRSDGSGTVTGGILFGGFKDLRMDTHVQFDRMQALAIRPEDAEAFYGDLYASGHVDITGPFNDLLLNVDAMTNKDGDLHIPIGSSASSLSRNLLTFTEPPQEVYIDPYELMMNTRSSRTKGQSDFTVRLRVHATPDVTAYVDIGEGNSLNGIGSGLVDIEARTAQNSFSINGDYTLSQGNFHFSALGLVSRDFAIQDGSTVRFNGDIMNSDLDVSGLYVTKTTLSNLLSDSTSVSRRTVECGIHITDKLRNPSLQLSINVPDLDPATQAQVESALNTEDKVQKQFLYLLITGGFLPDDDSGITTGGSNMLFSNVTSIMAGQLNNIFQKLDIPLDLGLNYQQNDKGSDLFDVALSTQLFNNRVIVNGTIGNRKLAGATNDEVSGDVDIEIKLDKPGTFRLNLFSHSADQYTNYLDNSQRNGIGIAYQREFSTFRQFFRDLFSSKRKREQRALENALNLSEKVTLQVDSAGRAARLNEYDERKTVSDTLSTGGK